MPLQKGINNKNANVSWKKSRALKKTKTKRQN